MNTLNTNNNLNLNNKQNYGSYASTSQSGFETERDNTGRSWIDGLACFKNSFFLVKNSVFWSKIRFFGQKFGFLVKN